MQKSFFVPIVASSLILVACQGGSEPTQPGITAEPATSSAALAVANSWSTRAPMPFAREYHAAESITDSNGDPLVYVFGGIEGDPNQEPDEQATVQVYNYRTDAWSTRTDSPVPLGYPNGVGRIGTKFYVAGGGVKTGQGGILYNSRLYRYDASRDRWTRLADMPHSGGQGVSGVIGGRLFVLTGNDNFNSTCEDCPPVATRRFFRYDPVTNVWQNRPRCPNFHGRGAAGVIDGKLYVVGGDGPNRNLDIYDPLTNKWHAGAPLPVARTGIAAAVAGNKLFVGGGVGTDANDPTYVYDPKTDRWATRASMPTPLALHAAAKLNVDGQAHIVAIGGTTNEVYTPW